MRLGILSDTHDEVTRTRLAVQLLRDAGAEALVHCGDLASPPIVEALAVLPAWFVFGNHDADMVPSLQRAAAEFRPVCLGWGGVVDLGGKRVGVAHGHMTTDVRRVLAEQPEFLLSGHSHAIAQPPASSELPHFHGHRSCPSQGLLSENPELTPPRKGGFHRTLTLVHSPE